jgi:hypothetical protein
MAQTGRNRQGDPDATNHEFYLKNFPYLSKNNK